MRTFLKALLFFLSLALFALETLLVIDSFFLQVPHNLYPVFLGWEFALAWLCIFPFIMLNKEERKDFFWHCTLSSLKRIKLLSILMWLLLNAAFILATYNGAIEEIINLKMVLFYIFVSATALSSHFTIRHLQEVH